MYTCEQSRSETRSEKRPGFGTGGTGYPRESTMKCMLLTLNLDVFFEERTNSSVHMTSNIDG